MQNTEITSSGTKGSSKAPFVSLSMKNKETKRISFGKIILEILWFVVQQQKLKEDLPFRLQFPVAGFRSVVSRRNLSALCSNKLLVKFPFLFFSFYGAKSTAIKK